MDTYLFLLLRATFVLSLTGAMVWALMAWTPLHHPRWHRFAWGLVLLQGLVLIPWSIQLSVPTFGLLALPDLPRDETKPVSIPREAAQKNESSIDASDPMLAVLTSPHDGLGASSSLPEWETATPLLSTDATDQDESNSQSISSSIASVSKTAATSPALLTTWSNWGIEQVRDVPWLRWLALVWLAGLSLVSIRLYVNYRILSLALRQTKSARPKWSRELQHLLVELNIRQPIKLTVHRELGPFLCWTPGGYQIVVPVGLWNQLSETERLAVLHHELCHLRRGDLWKAFCTRLIVACHWFNPFAWLAASRFDESAEWACDTQLAKEAPHRVTELANALLVATESRTPPQAYLTLAVTGGPTFQRIRRLVAPTITKDTWMKRVLWLSIFSIVVITGGIQWQLQPSSTLNAMSPTQVETNEGNDTDELGNEPQVQQNDDDDATQENNTSSDDLSQLKDYIAQIQVGDDKRLQRFVELLKTPSGQLLIKDRAAIAAQEADVNLNPDQIWQQFLEQNFAQQNGKSVVKTDTSATWEKYKRNVNASITDIEEIAQVFKQTASNIEGTSETAEVMKQLLNHEAAPAFVYQTELRSRLHPGISEIEESFQNVLVRDQTGQYVIRPARKGLVEKRLQGLNNLAAPLARFEQELAAWANDLAKSDDTHKRIANVLRMPSFAKFLMIQRLQEDLTLEDPHMDGIFDLLEDATNDTAKGLVFDLESDSSKELQAEMDRFEKIWNYRDAIAEPLHDIATKIRNSDALHEELRVSLETELGLLSVAVSMEYLPVTATEAAQEWLAQALSKNDNGKYELTIPSEEEFNSRVEDFYRQFRDLRRRGRIIDEFTTQLEDPALATAMKSIPGKHQLTALVMDSIPRPEVDGLQRWFENHFTQTDNGWQLNDGAGEVIDQFLNESAELEIELSKDDF